MLHIVKADEALYPIHIRLFGSKAEVLKPQRFPNLVQQFR